MKHILFVNQSLNRNTINMFEKIAEYYGHGYVITGSAILVESPYLTIIKAFPHNPSNYMTRIISWIGFLIAANRWLSANIKHIDKVFVYSNPPIAPLYMGYICRRRKIDFNIMIWDIYPQLLETMSVAPFIKPLTAFWHSMNRKLFRSASSVMTLGNIMKHIIDPHDEYRTSVVPNWSSPSRIKPINKEKNIFLEKYDIRNRFIVLYSGKMGIGHEISTILQAAQSCNDKEILFLFIGWGPGVNIVREFIKSGKSNNVMILPLQDEEMFIYSIASGDVGIVSQVAGLEQYFMPSKTYDMMSAGMPILGISSGDNDLKRTIDRHSCGYNVQSGDSDTLLKYIGILKSERERYADMCKSSREAVVNIYNEHTLFDKYRRLLKLDEND